ncbi:MAG: hypothetical protein ACK5WF_23475, partial [Cyclobacteriaceae bacterium]
MNGQSILFKVTVWVILIVNVFYTVSSVFITKELFSTRSTFTITNFIFYMAAVALLVEKWDAHTIKASLRDGNLY